MRRILAFAIPAILVLGSGVVFERQVNGRSFSSGGMSAMYIAPKVEGRERFTYAAEIVNDDRWAVRILSISAEVSGFDPPLPPGSIDFLINRNPTDRAFVGDAVPFRPFFLNGGESALLFVRGHARAGHAEVRDLRLERVTVRSKRLWWTRTSQFLSEPEEIGDQKAEPGG